MYQPMLFMHWRQVRYGLIPFVLATFALPLFMVQGLGTRPDGEALSLYTALGGVELWTAFLPILAVVIGSTLALSAWAWDHRLGHVHALSLPISRWRYTLLKMGAGVALLALPSVALWSGGIVAAAAVELPAGLHAYPTALAARFFMASLVTYALTFALGAATKRTTVLVLTGIVAFVVLSGFANLAAAQMLGISAVGDVSEAAWTQLTSHSGPFGVFTGNWSFIDV